MKHRLFLKLLAGYLIFGILGFLAVTFFTTGQTYRYMREQEADNLYLEAKAIASDYAVSYRQGSITLQDIQGHFSVLSSYLGARIRFVDVQGRILITSALGNADESAMQIPDFDITSFGTHYYQTGNFFDSLGEDCLTVYAPVIINYRVHGYVLIHKPISEIQKFCDGLLNISYATLAIIFACALLLLGLFTYTVYRPIHKLAKAAGAYASGNFETKVAIPSQDEIGYLAASLNFMATELNSLEEDQRKFVANISHDFRSPLTSIKGYIEAIMDGTIPPESQDKYLNIILMETERLNKLTESLLELNKYGSHGTMLELSDFDINHVIKMTVQSFEGTCTRKKISFVLILSGQELFVTADMSKIQQVLYNLIDNAIKFSHADSSITVETTERNEKVFVSVKDTGIGIPKESIKKIWERFYKTDASRGKDKSGTGLGLSIVKEIIQAHNENINVISTEGVGTEFIFTLPLANRNGNL